MLFLRALLFLGLLLLSGTARAQSPVRDGLRVPLPPVYLAYHWKLGEHRRPFALELAREARVAFGDTRTRVTVTLSHPQLYATLLESLRSTAKGGYTLLARESGFVAGFGRVTELSVVTDSKGNIWVQGTASIRTQRKGATASTQNRKLAIGFSPVVRAGALQLVPRSLSIPDLSAAMTRQLLASMETVELPVPACLNDHDLRLERVVLPAKGNAVEVTASVRAMSLSEMTRCLAEVSRE